MKIKLHYQEKGFATLLVASLVAVSAMVGIGVMVQSSSSNKESSVASNEFANVEVMSMAGVRAMHQYLVTQGAETVENIEQIGPVIPLRAGENEITATAIETSNCNIIQGICTVKADVITKNNKFGVTTTIGTVFALNVEDGVVVQQSQDCDDCNTSEISSGSVNGLTINADKPNTDVKLHVDGNLTILPVTTPFVIGDNVKSVSIITRGDIWIDCSIAGCDTPNINLAATGKITLLRGGNYGDVKANGDIKIGSLVEPAKSNSVEAKDNDDNGDTGEDDADNEQEEWMYPYKTDENGNYLYDSNGNPILDESKDKIKLNRTGMRAKNITTLSNVVLREVQVAGDIYAGKSVSILRRTDVLGKVEAGEDIIVQAGVVGINGENAANTIIRTGAQAGGNIEVSRGQIHGVVKAADSVRLRNSNSYIRGNVTAGENVTLWSNPVIEGNVKSKGSVQLRHGSRIGKNSDPVTVYAAHYVLIRSSSNIYGDIYGRGDSEYKLGIPKGAIYLATNGTLTGNSFSGKNTVVTATIGGKITGKATYSDKNKACILGFTTSDSYNIVNSINTCTPLGSIGSRGSMSHNTLISTINAGLKDEFFTISLTEIKPVVADFGVSVDVRVYKDEANYIFHKGVERGASRIYLNKLRNSKTGITYMYEFDKDSNGIEIANTGKQKAYDSRGNEVEVDAAGFYLGKYAYEGSSEDEYVGAICEEVDSFRGLGLYKSGTCTSEIIGFLPRVKIKIDASYSWQTGLGDFIGNLLQIDGSWGLPRAYGYQGNSGGKGNWILRSRRDRSSADNANLAPGVLYFEGNVTFEGDVHFDGSDGNAFTNSILAEGNIDASIFSPRLYSPYNVDYDKTATVSAVCDRPLKTVSGNLVSIDQTIPATQSDRFLRPANLCKSTTKFTKDMNKDENGKVKLMTIHGNQVDMLDLGFVAFMANEDIRIGSCAKIVGEIWAAGKVTVSSTGPLANCSSQVIGLINAGKKSKFYDDANFTSIDQSRTNKGNDLGVQSDTDGGGTFVEGVSLKWLVPK